MSKPPLARLCTVRRWKMHHDYGFSLSAVKSEVGHFISDVSEDHAACAAGLREHDFVVEVNSVNVVNKPHSAVVDLIKSDPDQFVMLVVDDEVKRIFDENNIPIDSQMESVVKIECPASGQSCFCQPNEIVSTKLPGRRSTVNAIPAQSTVQNSDHHKVITEDGFQNRMTPEKDSETEQTSDCTSDIVTSAIPPRTPPKVDVTTPRVHTIYKRQRNQDQTTFGFSDRKALVDQL